MDRIQPLHDWQQGVGRQAKPYLAELLLYYPVPPVQAVVDVISSSSWLNPALAAMEMAQMVTQGMWERDSVLTQIPHVTAETAARAKARNPPVETIFDLIDLEVR